MRSKNGAVSRDVRTQKPNRRRGTGSVIVRSGVYYGKWRGSDGQQVMKRLGLVRSRGTRDGLTQVQAEAELRRLMSDTHASVAREDRRTIAELAEAHLAIKKNAGLKRSTARGYESVVVAHLVPFFGQRTIDKISDASAAGLDKKLREDGLKAQTRRNVLEVVP